MRLKNWVLAAPYRIAKSQLYRRRVRPFVPRTALTLLRFIRSGDVLAFARFAFNRGARINLRTRLALLRDFYRVSNSVESAHTQGEILSFAEAVLKLRPTVEGDIIEAGCFKGGGTAKLSIVAKLAGRHLVACDSFRGIPANSEAHDRSIQGGPVGFNEGDYAGSLSEVQEAVHRFGKPDRTNYLVGWFDETLPRQTGPIAAVYLDVDLAASTRSCLKYLYPRLARGGVLFSQDGHLPLVVDVFRDRGFWEDEVGAKMPIVDGLGRRKLISLRKP